MSSSTAEVLSSNMETSTVSVNKGFNPCLCGESTFMLQISLLVADTIDLSAN